MNLSNKVTRNLEHFDQCLLCPQELRLPRWFHRGKKGVTFIVCCPPFIIRLAINRAAVQNEILANRARASDIPPRVQQRRALWTRTSPNASSAETYAQRVWYLKPAILTRKTPLARFIEVINYLRFSVKIASNSKRAARPANPSRKINKPTWE